MSRINQLARGKTAYGRTYVYMHQYCLLTRVLKAEKNSALCVHGGRASRTRVPFESLGLTGNLDWWSEEHTTISLPRYITLSPWFPRDRVSF